MRDKADMWRCINYSGVSEEYASFVPVASGNASLEPATADTGDRINAGLPCDPTASVSASRAEAVRLTQRSVASWIEGSVPKFESNMCNATKMDCDRYRGNPSSWWRLSRQYVFQRFSLGRTNY